MGQVPRASFLLIGGGRLARHLEFYLRSLDLTLQTWTRRQPVSDLKSKLGTASHILIAIPDREIDSFIQTNLGERSPKSKLVHFSGALSSRLAFGAHPLMTFADELYSIETYKEISFVVDEDAPNLSELLPCLPNRSFKISREKKALYHAYCVMSGNFSTLLWEKFFADLKSELGIPATAAKAYLKQVAQNLLDVADGKKKSVLTGPLVRGDLSTIETHLSALDKNFDSYSGIYRAFLTAESQRFHQAQGSSAKEEPAKEG